jgi:cell wall-associated NlpC family hydrolase
MLPYFFVVSNQVVNRPCNLDIQISPQLSDTSIMKKAMVMAVVIFLGSTLHSKDDVRVDIVQYSLEYLGIKYKYGGTGDDGFDCSGFTSHVYARFGYVIPRNATDQFAKGEKVSMGEALPGDLVAFRINYKKVSHVGIYLGKGRFIHAPMTGKRISIARLNNVYWKPRFAGFVRYVK